MKVPLILGNPHIVWGFEVTVKVWGCDLGFRVSGLGSSPKSPRSYVRV